MGASNRSAVATMVERTSRYVILAKLEAPTAEAAAEAIVSEMSRMATSLLKPLHMIKAAKWLAMPKLRHERG